MVKKEMNLINKLMLCLFIFIAVFFYLSTTNAVNELMFASNENISETIIQINSTFNTLNEGKNHIYFTEYYTAKILVSENPEIETISYFDNDLGKTVGYVNLFGGVGRDFTVYPGKVYEINTKKKIELKLR